MIDIVEIVEHTLKDTLKLIPFLFIAFLLLEYIEHKMSKKNQNLIKKSGKLGPLFGGVLCFSAAVLTFGLYCWCKLNKYWFSIIASNLAVILTLLLCIQESWWARYSPYFYLLPILALVLIFIAFNNEVKFFKFLIAVVCGVCVFLLVKNTNYFVKYVDLCIKDSEITRANLEEISEISKDKLVIVNH